MQTQLTIITVCFNSSATIYRTIESVISQTTTCIEYIIVDGNSTDNTLKIVDSFKYIFTEKEINFKVISEPDFGIYDAMNKGIKLASGDWIIFLNSDDYFCDNKVLEKVSRYFTSDADILYGKIAYIKDGNFIKESKQHLPKKLRYYCSIPHPATFMRKELLKRFNFDLNYRYAADYDLMYRLYRKNVKFELLPLTITCFSLEGLTANFRFKTRRDDLRIKIKNRDYFFALYSCYNLLKGLVGDILNRLIKK